MTYQEKYFEEVRQHLKRKRISWRKAISVCGYDMIASFMHTGNMASRTAEAIKFRIKEYNKAKA